MSHVSAPCQVSGVPFHVNPDSPSPKKSIGWIDRCIVKYKAKRHANKILNSLNEAKEIHEGKRAGRTLDDFLKDF